MSNYEYNGYKLINEAVQTRNGFNHFSWLYNESNNLLRSAKVHYINRTWEPYPFYTSMIRCIQEEIDFIAAGIKADYKAEHNLKVVRGKDKQELEYKIKNYYLVKELTEVIDYLRSI